MRPLTAWPMLLLYYHQTDLKHLNQYQAYLQMLIDCNLHLYLAALFEVPILQTMVFSYIYNLEGDLRVEKILLLNIINGETPTQKGRRIP